MSRVSEAVVASKSWPISPLVAVAAEIAPLMAAVVVCCAFAVDAAYSHHLLRLRMLVRRRLRLLLLLLLLLCRWECPWLILSTPAQTSVPHQRFLL